MHARRFSTACWYWTRARRGSKPTSEDSALASTWLRETTALPRMTRRASRPHFRLQRCHRSSCCVVPHESVERMALCVHVRVRARGEGHTLISTQQPNRGTCADIARSSDFELNLDDFAEALAGPSSARLSKCLHPATGTRRGQPLVLFGPP